MTAQLILGIDPGKTGALALLRMDGSIHDVIDMPPATGHALAVLIRQRLDDEAPLRIHAAFVEKVNYRPGQAGGWTFALGVGVLLGTLGAMGIPTVEVLAKTWKDTQGMTVPADTPKKDRDRLNKETSRLGAISRWPDDAGRFARKKDDGRADACHLARHGLVEVLGVTL